MPLLSIFAMVISSGLINKRLIAVEPNLDYGAPGVEVVKEFDSIEPGIPFREMIASWNVAHAESAYLKVEVKAHGDAFVSKWYTMGQWTLAPGTEPRGSVKGQADSDGTVDTDTLQLKHDAKSLDVRVTLKSVHDGPAARLKLLTFSFANGQADASANVPGGAHSQTLAPAWGKTIDVPERAQNNYPNGGVLCSATSMSMVLWYYANQLGKPEMNKDVPEVEEHVWDPVYKGAGNWPFNTAYAGSFPGIRSYVARFESISDLETWISAGFPVICSVSFDMLRGLPLSSTESGHLVVLVGFTKDGEPIFNDPAFKNQVRKSYKRSDFEKAWRYSNRTVYLVYPEGAKIPRDTEGLWFSP